MSLLISFGFCWRPTIFSKVFLHHVFYSTSWYCSTLCLKKVPTFELSVTLSNLNRFSKFLHCWKAYENCYKIHMTYPPHLRHVATIPWEIKNSNFLQIFSRYGRKCKQIAFLIASNFASRSPYWLQIKKFQFTVVLFIYFCDQFVAPDIRHSRRHYRVCQESTWYETTRTRFW